MKHIKDTINNIGSITPLAVWRAANVSEPHLHESAKDEKLYPTTAATLVNLLEAVRLFHDLLLELSEQPDYSAAEEFILRYPRSFNQLLALHAWEHRDLDHQMDLLLDLASYIENKLEVLSILKPNALPALQRRDQEAAARAELSNLEPLTLPPEQLETDLNSETFHFSPRAPAPETEKIKNEIKTPNQKRHEYSTFVTAVVGRK